MKVLANVMLYSIYLFLIYKLIEYCGGDPNKFNVNFVILGMSIFSLITHYIDKYL